MNLITRLRPRGSKKARSAPADVIERHHGLANYAPMLAGSSQISFIRFFEPFKHLRWGDRLFRQMRIERARADIWRVDQSRSRKFLGLSLVRKCFGYPCVRSRLSGLKRNVPRALRLAGHDETLSRLRRRLAVGDKPNFSEFWVTPSVSSGPQSTASRIRSPQSNPCHLLALTSANRR
jgi:hypothetical protein